MALVVNFIGVLSGLLTIFSFERDQLERDFSGSTIEVAVALDGPQLSNAGGDLPDVRIWNEIGDFVGLTVDPGTVNAGNVGEIMVTHESQGVYTLFSANDDAICIAWATTTFTKNRGGNMYVMTGDIAESCGAAWYPSNLHTSIKVKDTSQDHQPNCFWIDGNGDQPDTGFQVYWPAFAESQYSPDERDPKKLCNGIDFGLRQEHDPNSITYRPKTKRSLPLRSRGSAMTRPEWANNELVISDSASHSAKKMCMSDTSMGPDFVHMGERLFCDMDSKVLYPFCEDIKDKDADCFDMESRSIKFGGQPNMKLLGGSGDEEVKDRYPRVRNWTSNSNMA